VIVSDWSWYPSQGYHVLRASLRAIPLLSHIVPYAEQQKAIHYRVFLDNLARAVNPEVRVIIVTDAGFQNAWFWHIQSLG
ncbi:TPA: IS4/IS5 family transposase, partial [Salmonella enterica subsp. enterica serovar Eastbourne]|nr:IS4/IS5 family transposase [Salmonella enterica subsp. enterica serovar Eastbourne]